MHFSDISSSIHSALSFNFVGVINSILNNILKNGKILAVALDHGLTIGPVNGLTSMNKLVNDVQNNGATAIIIHKGISKILTPKPKIQQIIHLSASTTLSVFPDDKAIVGNVDNAIQFGADAVSVHVNIGSSHDHNMLKDLSQIVDECYEKIPLLAMMYPRGEKISNEYDPKIIAHVARIGAELGADVVKTLYTGNSETFKEVVDGCPVPLVIAGGPNTNNDIDILNMVYGAMKAGAAGVSIGRKIFQHTDPGKITKAMSSIIFENKSVDDAMEILK